MSLCGAGVQSLNRVLGGFRVHLPAMNTHIPSLMQGAEPYFHHGGDTGCLCLHGLAASPAEVRWLGEHLAGHNLTVYIPRLAGHGTDYHHLRHLHWQDWYASALDGYHLLRQMCRKVFVVGHSMGGLLALLMGASEPVDGLVILATPVQHTNSRLLPYAFIIKLYRPYVHLPDTTDFPKRLLDEQKRRGEAAVGRVRYDIWASQAVDELYRLMRIVDVQLPGVTAPTLLIHSKADETVPFSNQAYVRQHIRSAVIETMSLEKSGHIVTQDVEHMIVFERTAQFILQHQ